MACTTPDTSKSPHCLLFSAIEAGDLPDSVKKMLRTERRGGRNQKDCAMISNTVNDKMYHGISYIPADSESDLQMSAAYMEVTVQSQPPKCYAFRRCGVSAK